jgi:hypothetical protein
MSPDLDPIHLIIQAEERLMGFRQNLQRSAWDMALKASESAAPEELDALIRLHAGIRAIDFALASKPSVYSQTTPI